MNVTTKYLAATLAALLPALAVAQEQDLPDSTSQADNRNMMLNAESASAPREINIGLPESGMGAIIFIDGTKHAQGLVRGQYHWAGGNAYHPVGSISLMEAVITTGEVGVLVDSRTRTGTDTFGGDVTLATSSNGLLRFDGAVRGPVSKLKGWYYAASAYANYDPTAVNAPGRRYVDQRQIYGLALSRRWEESSLDIIYRFSKCDDNVDGTYSKAPFVYNGDGSVSKYGGFRIGRDCYFPENDALRYMDIRTGEIRESDITDMDSRTVHDISVIGRHTSGSGWSLSANFHGCIVPPSQYVKVSISGVDDAVTGYSLADGTAYTGKIQNRFIIVDDFRTADLDLSLKAAKRFGRRDLRLGLVTMYANQREAGSTAYFAHTVEADPVRVFKDGRNAWNFNRSGQYFQGNKGSLAFWGIDDWRVSDRFLVRTGLRARPMYLDIKTAARLGDEDKNVRVEGFNLADPALCNLHGLHKSGIDLAASEHLSYTISDKVFAVAEGFWSRTNKTTTYYKNATIPSTKPVGNALASCGLMYDDGILDATASVTYITSWDNAAVLSVSRQVGGVSETIPWTAQYGIGTLGCTMDANLKTGGFKLHTLVTWQDPRYKNYSNEFVFSDGSTTSIDYTGKYVTGISKVLVEFDPSYSWERWRVWASMRYYSRQYASRTNYAYFNGHYESFAGADLTLRDDSKISLNVVNVLCDNGVKGTIDIADTISDPSELDGYIMAGSYIRPFEVQLSYTRHF